MIPMLVHWMLDFFEDNPHVKTFNDALESPQVIKAIDVFHRRARELHVKRELRLLTNSIEEAHE